MIEILSSGYFCKMNSMKSEYLCVPFRASGVILFQSSFIFLSSRTRLPNPRLPWLTSLPIFILEDCERFLKDLLAPWNTGIFSLFSISSAFKRSEEHTSELQSQFHLVCRLLLEKKKNKK